MEFPEFKAELILSFPLGSLILCLFPSPLPDASLCISVSVSVSVSTYRVSVSMTVQQPLFRSSVWRLAFSIYILHGESNKRKICDRLNASTGNKTLN